MNLRSIGLLAVLLCSPPLFARTPVDAERRLHDDLQLQDYTVAYKDARGQRIEFADFDEALRGGRSFAQYKNPMTKIAVLALEDDASHASHDHPHGAHAGGAAAPALSGAIRVGGDDGPQSLASGMGIEGYAISYTDAAGNPIDFDQLSAGMAKGHSISVTKNAKDKTATVSLDATFDAAATPPVPSVAIGSALPPFTLRTLDGRTVDNAALRGRPTLLSFHFADCVPCIREIPMLNAFARDHADFNLYAVTFDDIATSTAFVAEHAPTWPVLPDAQAFIDAVGVKTYPTMLVVDATGIVRAAEFGVERLTDAATLKTWADAALATNAAPKRVE